jgi:hypothetical protein
MAEREGFEPPVPDGYNRFRVCRIRPLCHLSAADEGQFYQVSFSRPSMYARSAAGTVTEPSAFW